MRALSTTGDQLAGSMSVTVPALLDRLHFHFSHHTEHHLFPRLPSDFAPLVRQSLLRHAGLALSVGIGALANALWLLVGLKRRGSYQPAAGWGVFLLQVLAATALLAVFLMWAAQALPWLQWRGEAAKRAVAMAGILAASGLIYFGALWAAGLKLRQFVTR